MQLPRLSAGRRRRSSPVKSSTGLPIIPKVASLKGLWVRLESFRLFFAWKFPLALHAAKSHLPIGRPPELAWASSTSMSRSACSEARIFLFITRRQKQKLFGYTAFWTSILFGSDAWLIPAHSSFSRSTWFCDAVEEASAVSVD